MKKQPSRPGGERHFETGRSAVRDSIRAYAENDGWRVESCPPVGNGPVTIIKTRLKMSSNEYDWVEERYRLTKEEIKRAEKNERYGIAAIVISLLSILISILKFAIRHL